MQKIFRKIYGLFENIPLYMYCLVSYLLLMLGMVLSLNDVIKQTITQEVSLYLAFFLLFLLLRLLVLYFHKIYVSLFAVLFLVFFASVSYAYYNGFTEGSIFFDVLWNTSFREAKDFLSSMVETDSFRFVCLTYVLPILCFLCLFLISAKRKKRANLLHFGMSAILCFLIIFLSAKAFHIGLQKHVKTGKAYTYLYEKDKGDENEIVVLMLGESLRGDHFGLNGYERNTTPRLSKEKNLISFVNAHSSRLDTVSSFKTIMSNYDSRISFHDLQVRESIFSLYSKLNYETALISTNVTRSLYRLWGKDLENTKMHLLSGYDEGILPVFQKFIEEKEHKKFVLLHTYSGHYTYYQSVPNKEGFRVFNDIKSQKTLQSMGCNCAWSLNGKNLDKIINDYDNAVVYTDFIVSSVIERLRDKNAFLIFTSDHGESFGERGQACLHFFDVPEVWRVPFMVWASDKWIEKNQQQWSRIRKAAQDEKDNVRNISHRNLVASLLHCNHISTDYYDSEYSLCSESFNPDFFEGCERFEKRDCMPCECKEMNMENADFLHDILPAKVKYKKMPSFKEKVFMHAVNSPLILREHLFEYTNFEIDVFIRDGKILTGHEPMQKEEAYLEDLLKMFPDTSQNIFWLDVKNLSRGNQYKFLNNLELLLQQYHIKNEQVIIESPTIASLELFAEHGFITSFYFRYTDKLDKEDLIQRVKLYNSYPTHCISSDIKYMPIIQYLFPNHCHLFWAVNECKCEQILNFPNTRAVILLRPV